MTTAAEPYVRTSSSSFDQDRRAFPRKRAKAVGSYHLVGRPLDRPIMVKLHDISQGGVCILALEKFSVGTELEIELIPTAGPGRLVETAEVRWSARGENGLFRVGCRWNHQLSYSDWHLFT